MPLIRTSELGCSSVVEGLPGVDKAWYFVPIIAKIMNKQVNKMRIAAIIFVIAVVLYYNLKQLC